MKLAIGITGASGVSYAITLLDFLKSKKEIELYIILSEWGEKILRDECNIEKKDLLSYTPHIYSNDELDSPLSSTSFVLDGFVIVPATVKTVSHIATGNTEELITRVADNMLRMKRKLIIGIRETPLSSITLENLYKISIAGGIILPLSPAFYHKPSSIEDLRRFIAGKILDILNIKNELYERWS